jgi:hypothetical protein
VDFHPRNWPSICWTFAGSIGGTPPRQGVQDFSARLIAHPNFGERYYTGSFAFTPGAFGGMLSSNPGIRLTVYHINNIDDFSILVLLRRRADEKQQGPLLLK